MKIENKQQQHTSGFEFETQTAINGYHFASFRVCVYLF